MGARGWTRCSCPSWTPTQLATLPSGRHWVICTVTSISGRKESDSLTCWAQEFGPPAPKAGGLSARVWSKTLLLDSFGVNQVTPSFIYLFIKEKTTSLAENTLPLQCTPRAVFSAKTRRAGCSPHSRDTAVPRRLSLRQQHKCHCKGSFSLCPCA